MYDEKLKELAEETEKAERRYEIRLDEYAQKLLSEQASLEEVSSEHMEQLISRYEKISEELSNYKIEMYSEIDERTRRGLSQLSSGLEEKLSELSIKENEYSELLKEESRSYTELLEEVYKSNVEEHRAFELKIRENVAEVEKSISKIRSVGESESNRLLSEYTRIHEKVCELSSDLEAKKSTLEKSLEESLLLYVSKLGVKYSEIENQMSMLEESFGECIKAQSHVALKELTSGRETLLSIRQEMEALKTSGEEERGNLHNKYLEIEKSLLELKGNYEKRLSEVVEEAGEAACEELSKQLAELSERYEISRKESEILYGELSGEIESSGKLLSSLKEELNVLSENSKLLQNEMLCKLNEEICQLRENTENEICALGKMSRTEYEELCREHNEELKNLRESTAEAVKALRQEVERDLSISLKEVSEVSEEIKGLRESYAVSLSNQTEAESNYLESLKELREEHEESELSVRKQFALYENKLSELNLNYSRNLDLGILAAKREIEKLLSYGKESLSESVQEANEELKELLASNKSDYDLIKTLYGKLENELKEDFTRESLERFASLRTEFESLLIRGENKLEEVEKYYSKELSRMFDERSEQLKGLETRFSVLGVKLESKDEEFGRSCDLLNEELRRYAGELDAIRGSLNELGSQVGPEVLEKIRESEKSLELRLNEMGERCEEFLREIEQNFTEERSEELSEYSRNIQALKAEMSEAGELLKVRLSDEISEARREARVEFGREVEKKLSEYENDLCNRYEELTEKLHKELSGYRIKLSELESYSESKIKEVTEYYDEQTGSQYRKFSEKLQDYSSRFMSLETRISQLSNVVESELEVQRDKIKTYGEELSERYEEKSLELCKEFEELSVEVNVVLHELESGVCEQSEALKDLSAGYVKLRDELEHSREALSDYRREMSESGEELRKEYAVQYEEYNAEVESRLSKLNEEIGERVEDSLSDVIAEYRDNIFARTEDSIRQITDLVKQRIDAIQQTEGDCEKELKIRIDSYGEEIKNMQLHCSELEMQYENAVRDGLRKADSTIEKKLIDIQDYISKEKIAISKVYQEQIEDGDSRMNSLINKAKEYQTSYENLAVKMANLENDITGKVNIYLEQVVANLEEPIADAKRELAAILVKVNGLKDVIENKTRLMADEILKELSEKTENIVDAAENRSVEWENRMNELFNSVENHLTDCKTAVQTQAERLQKLEATYQAQLSRKLGETDKALEDELNKLHKAFLVASEKLSKETSSLYHQYEERERDLFASTQDTVKEMENKITGLDFRIESISEEIGGKLEKQFAAAQEKMNRFTERQEKLYQTKVEELQVQLKSELETMQLVCSSKLTEMQANVDNKTQDIYLKLNKIYDNFSVDAMKFDNENRERYRDLLEKMEAAVEKVDTLREELSVGMEERIKREFQIADELFLGKTQEMKENILRMETENKNQLDDYHNELMRVQDALDVIENDYAQIMQNKLAALDGQAEQQLTDIKTALSDSVEFINNKMIELSDKVKSVETSYTEKAEFMLFNQEQKWKEVEDKYNNFDEHIDAVYRRLPNAAKEMDEVLAIGKAKLEDAIYSQIEQQKQHFREVEMQLDAKASSLNKKMQEMQRSIRDIDSRFTAQYLERSGVLDERIASIEFDISKFERNIMLVQKTGEMKDELEREICILKDTVAEVKADKNKMEALGERMAELEKSASERYEKLFAESQSYEDLNVRIKDLQSEIESVENKTQDLRDMRIATQQLDSKFIVLERQFGRLDSMIGKIETSEAIAKDYSQKLNEMRLNVSELRQMMNMMESQWQEMEIKRKVYGEKMEHFESEADLILNSQSQINAVMTKFKQMDLLVEDLESRTGAVRHLQDWLIRAETRMENMKSDLQRVLPEEKVVETEKSNSSLVESIRELHRQGMSVDDIAKIVGTSREEVDFALELEEVLTSKR